MKELNKAVNSIHIYFKLKDSSGLELARSLMMYGYPEMTKGMVITALEVIAIVGERGLNGEYQYDAEMEQHSITAREMMGM